MNNQKCQIKDIIRERTFFGYLTPTWTLEANIFPLHLYRRCEECDVSGEHYRTSNTKYKLDSFSEITIVGKAYPTDQTSAISLYETRGRISGAM